MGLLLSSMTYGRMEVYAITILALVVMVCEEQMYYINGFVARGFFSSTLVTLVSIMIIHLNILFFFEPYSIFSLLIIVHSGIRVHVTNLTDNRCTCSHVP